VDDATGYEKVHAYPPNIDYKIGFMLKVEALLTRLFLVSRMCRSIFTESVGYLNRVHSLDEQIEIIVGCHNNHKQFCCLLICSNRPTVCRPSRRALPVVLKLKR